MTRKVGFIAMSLMIPDVVGMRVSLTANINTAELARNSAPRKPGWYVKIGEASRNPADATKWVPIEVNWGNYVDNATAMEEVIEARAARLRTMGAAAEVTFGTKFGRYILRRQDRDEPFPASVYADVPKADKFVQIASSDFKLYADKGLSTKQMLKKGVRIRAVCRIKGKREVAIRKRRQVPEVFEAIAREEKYKQDRNTSKHANLSAGCASPGCRRTVAIIGGGPVGLFTALELVKKEYDVTLLENTVYIGEWKQNDHFTRGQILLVQDDAAEGYQSLRRLHRLLPSDLWERLLSRSCGPTPPPMRGTMTCAPLNSAWRAKFKDEGGKLSISIRELQLILYEALVRAGGVVHFTKGWSSFVDHRGHVFYQKKLIVKDLTPYLEQLQRDWQNCGAIEPDGTVSPSMDNIQFARCWKMVKHPGPNEDEMSSDSLIGSRSAVAQRMLNMIHGDGHPLNCKEKSLFKGPGKCRMDQGTWLDMMHAIELVPDILICADGKIGECRNIVGLSKVPQKPQGLDPVAHKKNGQAWGLLLQIAHEHIPELMKKSSSGFLEALRFGRGTPLVGKERSDVQTWPTVQHRFRAFPSRYYTDTQEDFYFAAGLTKDEFEEYTQLCVILGEDKCDGYFGYYARNSSKQFGFENTCDSVDKEKQSQCRILHGRLLSIFKSALAWTNVPFSFWGDLIRGARISAFKILFLKAKQFARKVAPGRHAGLLAFAVGDAAMDVHFFSGTGVNIGFKSARILTDLLGQWQGSPAFRPGTKPIDGAFAAEVHKDTMSFAHSDHASEEAAAAKKRFREYGDRLPNPLRETWLDDGQLVQEYHEILELLLTHKHMDSSYKVLHAGTYEDPTCDDDSNTTCLPCGAVNCKTSACLEPVTKPSIALTRNQRRIVDWMSGKGSMADWGTSCALRETYGTS